MQTEYRALDTYTNLPAGCVLHPVTDEDTEPHARLEYLIIKSSKDARLSSEIRNRKARRR